MTFLFRTITYIHVLYTFIKMRTFKNAQKNIYKCNFNRLQKDIGGL